MKKTHVSHVSFGCASVYSLFIAVNLVQHLFQQVVRDAGQIRFVGVLGLDVCVNIGGLPVLPIVRVAVGQRKDNRRLSAM